MSLPHYAVLPEHQRLGLDGEPLKILDLPLPLPSSSSSSRITNFKTVGSYSWVDVDEPVISVPAAPPIADFQIPMTVVPDSSPKLIDEQALRLPNSPLEPMIQVSHLLSPSLDFSSLQIVTDRSNLRKIFGAISGSINAWRIDAEFAGDGTMLLSKQEGGVWDHFECFKGYNDEFQKVQTKPAKGCEGLGTHYRMSTYTLGGLNFLVRYKVDAQKAPVWQSRRTSPSSSSPSVPNLTSFFETHANVDTPTSFAYPSLLSYQVSKTTIPPQSSLMSIRTKPGHKFFLPSKQWDQLFFVQIPVLFVAFYSQKGRMRRIDPFPLNGGEMGRLTEFGEDEGKRDVELVVRVLKEMREIVLREWREGKGASFMFEHGRLRVWRTKEEKRKRLDEGLLSLF